MSYSAKHTDDECDKCLKNVGKANLKPAPFLYLDRNDDTHPDAMLGDPRFKDYKQYFLCKKCWGKA